jgi:hypothetical protein
MAEKARVSIDRAVKVGLEEAAQRTLEELVGSSALDNHLRRPLGSAAIEALRGEEDQFFPIAIVPPAVSSALAAETRVALLSAASLGKQLERHPELERAFYAALSRMGDWPQRAYLMRDGTVRVYADTPDGLIRMAFKPADAGRELFLVSMHPTRSRDEAATAAVAELVEKAR